MTLTPDGNYLFSAGSDSRIRAWNVRTGERLLPDPQLEERFPFTSPYAKRPESPRRSSKGRKGGRIRTWRISDLEEDEDEYEHVHDDAGEPLDTVEEEEESSEDDSGDETPGPGGDMSRILDQDEEEVMDIDSESEDSDDEDDGQDSHPHGQGHDNRSRGLRSRRNRHQWQSDSSDQSEEEDDEEQAEQDPLARRLLPQLSGARRITPAPHQHHTHSHTHTHRSDAQNAIDPSTPHRPSRQHTRQEYRHRSRYFARPPWTDLS